LPGGMMNFEMGFNDFLIEYFNISMSCFLIKFLTANHT
jgi:hypothetical protein